MVSHAPGTLVGLKNTLHIHEDIESSYQLEVHPREHGRTWEFAHSC